MGKHVARVVEPNLKPEPFSLPQLAPTDPSQIEEKGEDGEHVQWFKARYIDVLKGPKVYNCRGSRFFVSTRAQGVAGQL